MVTNINIGVYVIGYAVNCLFNIGFSRLFPGIDVLTTTLPMNFWLPFWREYMMSLGSGTCAKEDIVPRINQAKPGSALFLAIGSAEEFLHMKSGTMRLVVKKRKGFIKIALQTGSNLIPMIGFGENESAYVSEHPIFNPIHSVFYFFFKSSAPIFFGGNYGLPSKNPLITVVGTPIKVAKVENPTNEDIDKLQEHYTQCLLKLYDDYKDTHHRYRTEDMKIVC
jgi:2-acylglycerol O-acyltransferase 2